MALELGKLYLVSTPIGNPEDITLRAIRILKQADVIICEEFKEGMRLLRQIGLTRELLSINEHNEKENTEIAIQNLLEGKNVALISDCGAPVFSDPGLIIVQRCIESGISIIPLPGGNSMIPALIASGFPLNSFYYAGWLPRKTEERKNAWLSLKAINELLVIMETPYRLSKMLEEIHQVLGTAPAVLAFDLTKPTELFLRGTAQQILREVKQREIKGEFVLIVNNRKYKLSSKK